MEDNHWEDLKEAYENSSLFERKLYHSEREESAYLLYLDIFIEIDFSTLFDKHRKSLAYSSSYSAMSTQNSKFFQFGD